MHDDLLKAPTLWELLCRRVDRTPDAPMLLDADGRRFTFADLKRAAETTAAGFFDMGVRDGTAVTWQLPTRIETVIASFALSRIGAVQNPVIHIYRDKEVGFCIRQTGASLVLTPGVWKGYDYHAMAERVTAAKKPRPNLVPAYDSLPSGDPSALPSPPTDGETVRWIYYTSGTTSDPKGVRHTDQTLIAGGVGLALAVDMRADDVGSIAFPYAHIGGPDYVVAMLLSGFPALLMESFVPADAVDVYRRSGVTIAGGGPAFYSMLLAEQRTHRANGEASGSGRVIPSLRQISGGGAPLPEELFHEVHRELGIRISHGYGMTECPMISQGAPHRDSDEQLSMTEGRPVLGCEVSIVDADGHDVGPGVVGEVRVAGPMLFKGYTDDALNVAFDERGRFRTGDLGMLREDGHLRLTGRLKDVIIRKGENVSAQEVEETIYAHPCVAAVAVIGLPDSERGERVCAVVELHPDATLSFEQMVQWCRDAGLMTQKIPEQLELRSSLPRNATLKVLKYQLREELAGSSPVHAQ